MSRLLQPQIGDLVWQARIPGGICIFLGEVEYNEEYSLWEVLHPTEGLIQDPDYYFDVVPSYTQ